jgi:hypothetical protein
MKNSTTRILTIAVVLLLLANIALVYFMMTGKRHAPKKEGRREPMEMMAKELKMTEQQQKDYKTLKEEHFKNVRPLFDSVRSAKTRFFGLMKETSVNDSTMNAYEQKVLDQQAKLDRLTFEHFRKVRALFTAEQLPKYDSFITKMMYRGRR